MFSACLAGLVAGILLTAIQQLQVTPIIVEAETHEPAAPRPRPTRMPTAAATSMTAGLRRTDSNARSGRGVANVGMGIGFALLLAAAFSLRSGVSWRQGILWGIGGYAAFFALPAFGLPPELPGTEAAELQDRQVWWLVTVTLSAVGIALLGLTRGWPWKALAIALIALPHLIGAPHSETHSALAPPELLQAFIVATGGHERRLLGGARRRLRDRVQEARLTRLPPDRRDMFKPPVLVRSRGASYRSQPRTRRLTARLEHLSQPLRIDAVQGIWRKQARGDRRESGDLS